MSIDEKYYERFGGEDWAELLNEKLSFPFAAEVSEFQEDGPIQQGDKLKVHSMEGADDKYGVIVSVKIGRKKYYFPLVDLEPITKDEKCNNYIKDYKEWF